MLGCAAWLQRSDPRPVDYEPFFAECADAVRAVPAQAGSWVGEDQATLQAAVELLRPNVVRTIAYVDFDPDAVRRPGYEVSMTVVQCKRTEDMQGHWPPNCYPAYGDRPVGEQARDWQVGRLSIPGVVYAFDGATETGRAYRRTVYNFMVVPTRGFARDMTALTEAAEDYRLRHYGAAQVQVVFKGPAGQEPTEAERDAVFVTLTQTLAPALERMAAGRRE